MGLQIVLVLCALIGAYGIYFAWKKLRWVFSLHTGDAKATKIASHIRQGAHAFLVREYTILSYGASAVALLWLYLADGPNRWAVMCFLIGAMLSGGAGLLGMIAATHANVRTAHAAIKSLDGALQVAFSAGTVMGMFVGGFIVTGSSILLLFLVTLYGVGSDALSTIIFPNMLGFGFGASSVALFARVGGGIYTKAADVGGDNVAKMEAGLPEDDPRNPAVIADLVGDNVGDICGMGADLFESYAASIIVTATLAVQTGVVGLIALPFVVASVGLIASMVGSFFVDGAVDRSRFRPYPNNPACA